MAGKRVLVIGGNFGGLTAALELKHELGDEVDVTVVSASDRFLFNPSLIWLPFGKRDAAHITFPLAPTFDAHGIGFVHAQATAIDPAARTVATTGGSYGYDYLVVATGFRNKFDIVPGLGPDGYAQTITTLADAERAGTAWRKFLDDPGPVVIGATQGASCFGAAYEFLFNTSHQLRKAKLHKKVPLTFVTAEPFVGHFGIGGLPGGEKLLNMFLKKEGIRALTGVAFEEVTGDRIKLTDGTAVPFRYAMVMPPFAGQDVEGRAARQAQGLRRDGRGVHDGRRQQRRDDPRRPHAPPAQGRNHDPRPAGARHEGRVREVLPVEEPPRLRTAAVMVLRQPGCRCGRCWRRRAVAFAGWTSRPSPRPLGSLGVTRLGT